MPPPAVVAPLPSKPTSVNRGSLPLSYIPPPAFAWLPLKTTFVKTGDESSLSIPPPERAPKFLVNITLETVGRSELFPIQPPLLLRELPPSARPAVIVKPSRTAD